MPLLDHFRPPLDAKHHWESFHSNWATRLADQLNERLPEGFSAEENTRIDLFPESFEVRVFKSEGGLTLVGAIVLISPGHKGAPQERRAFAINCVGYLQHGVSLILVDIVTSRRANLHDETVRLLAAEDGSELGADVNLYAVAYRPVLSAESSQIDVWTEICAVGARLPTLPLRLTGDLFVAVDFEAAYQEACRRRRLG